MNFPLWAPAAGGLNFPRRRRPALRGGPVHLVPLACRVRARLGGLARHGGGAPLGELRGVGAGDLDGACWGFDRLLELLACHPTRLSLDAAHPLILLVVLEAR